MKDTGVPWDDDDGFDSALEDIRSEFARNDPDFQPAEKKPDLNAELFEAAKNNNAALVKSLLAKGAEADAGSETTTPLHWAAFRGYADIVKILVEAGADISRRDEDHLYSTALDYARQQNHNKVRKILEELCANPVTFRQPVGGGYLEEIFNFETLERVTLLHPASDGPAVSFQRDHFSELKDQKTLRQAFNEHVKRGGRTEECDVFPDAPKKLDKTPKLD